MKPTPPQIDPAVETYLAAVPEPARAMILQLRELIRAVAPPDATESISYAMPAFKHQGTIVCYAAFTHHCSLFPMGNAAIKAFEAELKPYSTSKGTIRFPLGQPLPAALIQKIVRARVTANESKKPPRRLKESTLGN